MQQMQRYAVYYAPRDGQFADAAAAWLGRDARSGADVPQPRTAPPLAKITAGARRYGFHGTLRAPFRLADDYGVDDLVAKLGELAGQLAPAASDGVQISDLHSFLALTLAGAQADIAALAAQVVQGTDAFRAPLTGEEITRRSPDTLTVRQRDLLHGWGYPFVMEEFQFHLTLTDQLAPDQIGPVRAAAQAHFADLLPRPFVIEDLCLFGEDGAGVFHLMHRFALSG